MVEMPETEPGSATSNHGLMQGEPCTQRGARPRALSPRALVSSPVLLTSHTNHTEVLEHSGEEKVYDEFS